jgi:hypothetical protein
MEQDRTINVLVVSGSKPEALQYVLIARELLGRGILMHIAASRRHVYEFVRQQGWEHAVLMEIKEPDASGEPDLKACIEKYSDPTVAEMVASEQAVRDWDAGRRLLLLTEFLDT